MLVEDMYSTSVNILNQVSVTSAVWMLTKVPNFLLLRALTEIDLYERKPIRSTPKDHRICKYDNVSLSCTLAFIDIRRAIDEPACAMYIYD